jgi:hypothetical protein
MKEDTNIPKGLCTFDDGLYSQYLYGKDLPNDKIFFICPSFINKGHNDLKQKCMSINDIKELIDMGIEIGAHSYYHTKLEKLPDLKHQLYHIQRDTDNMMEWFKDSLGIVPTKFCFPYNNDLDGIYKAALSKYNFTDFYGSSRVDIPA